MWIGILQQHNNEQEGKKKLYDADFPKRTINWKTF